MSYEVKQTNITVALLPANVCSNLLMIQNIVSVKLSLFVVCASHIGVPPFHAIRGHSWWREICNFFLLISSVARHLKPMQHLLQHLRYQSVTLWWLWSSIFVLFISSISNLPTPILSNLYRLLVMRTHQPLFVSPRRQLMLDRSLQSCMLLNWVPSQVCILRKNLRLIFFFVLFSATLKHLAVWTLIELPNSRSRIAYYYFWKTSEPCHCSYWLFGYRETWLF